MFRLNSHSVAENLDKPNCIRSAKWRKIEPQLRVSRTVGLKLEEQ
jgi:hypothetical protein